MEKQKDIGVFPPNLKSENVDDLTIRFLARNYPRRHMTPLYGRNLIRRIYCQIYTSIQTRASAREKYASYPEKYAENYSRFVYIPSFFAVEKNAFIVRKILF